MDILASILAYLGCMTAVVAAMAISLAAFLSAPDQVPNVAPKQSIAITAKPGAPKVITTAVAKEPAKLDQELRGSSIAAQHTTSASTKAASARSKMLAARAQKMRRFVQEERARRWAYQQDPDFDARFLGYAD